MIQLFQMRRNRSTKLEHLLDWTVNMFIVAVLPARIGVLGAPLWFFLVYAATAGIVLMLAEDVRYVRDIFTRSDVRNYLQVRIGIIVSIGIIPFLLARAVTL